MALLRHSYCPYYVSEPLFRGELASAPCRGNEGELAYPTPQKEAQQPAAVSYTHLRAHETSAHL
eukprot:15458752-Alexandrium_andersonii.AAC.1